MEERGPASKRFRRDEDPTNPHPSIVVHVRNLNADTTESDLIDALMCIGPVAYVTCMPNKGMALVEFESLESARQCVSISQQNPIDIGGAPALFNYSTSPFIQRTGLECERRNRTLVVSVARMIYPINVRVLHKIFSKYGKVLRIVVLRRNGITALVEFESSAVAREAKLATNGSGFWSQFLRHLQFAGADIYADCCNLKVEYAKVETVKVSRPSLDSWDYELMPEGPSAALRNYHSANMDKCDNSITDENLMAAMQSPTNQQLAQAQQKALLDAARDSAARDFAPHPPHLDESNAYGARYDAYGVAAGASSADRYDGYGGGGGGGERGGGGGDRGPRMRFAPQNQGYDDYDRYANAPSYENERGGPRIDTAVVMIYGINHRDYNPQRIFNVCCCYGNVLKVKFLQSKTDTCMVQMGSAHEAANVMRFLDGCSMFGSTLQVRPSKQNNLRDLNQEPFLMENGSPSFHDFYGDRNQRFMSANMAARNRIVFPSAQLHFFNVPVGFTEQQIMQLFTNSATPGPVPINILKFNVKSAHSLSGLVTFSSTEEALEALMIHNHSPISDPGGNGPYILKMTLSDTRK